MHFYGWTIDQLDNVSVVDIKWLSDAMLRINAQETLVKLNISDYPNMGSNDRRKFHKSIHEKAYPLNKKDLRTTEDLARFLNG